MIIDELQISDRGFKIYVTTISKDDILICREILHGIVCANYQVLDSFENYDIQIGKFSLEYNLNMETVEIENFN